MSSQVASITAAAAGTVTLGGEVTVNRLGFGHRKRRDQVQALATGRLAERGEAQIFQPLFELQGSLDDATEAHIWRWIQIEHESAGDIG